ncbi:hypothetical protein [Granulicella arctica]|uniref:hypothetical protein n=1 Tax=Granulicella arctica TaxID=940613 RepID=UPI0021E05AFD|nr:hypothetical protein [Granulicella arctica]
MVLVLLLLAGAAAAQTATFTGDVRGSSPQPIASVQEKSSPTPPIDLPPSKCVEAYLSSDAVHRGTDYGAAITAATQSSSLTTPTELKVCVPGDHPVYTKAVLDRPVKLVMSGARLIPQPSMSSPVETLAATAQSGTAILKVPSTSALTVGMACGGIGIQPGAYITSTTATTVTLSLPSKLEFSSLAELEVPNRKAWTVAINMVLNVEAVE